MLRLYLYINMCVEIFKEYSFGVVQIFCITQYDMDKTRLAYYYLNACGVE